MNTIALQLHCMMIERTCFFKFLRQFNFKIKYYSKMTTSWVGDCTSYNWTVVKDLPWTFYHSTINQPLIRVERYIIFINEYIKIHLMCLQWRTAYNKALCALLANNCLASDTLFGKAFGPPLAFGTGWPSSAVWILPYGFKPDSCNADF